MQFEKNIIEVYHAGTDRIEKPDCLKGRKNLDFIVGCRSGKEIWKEYDYVGGGVADDRVINTVNLYIQGFISKNRALMNLKYLKPNNQICILNQELTDYYLKFIDCIDLENHGLL